MFTTYGNYPQRRTFLASRVTNERLRAQLNDDIRTSEYLTSRKWCVINKYVSEVFATRREAREFCKANEQDENMQS